MPDVVFKARQQLRAVIEYVDPTENKHTARALSSIDAIVDDVAAEIARLQKLCRDAGINP